MLSLNYMISEVDMINTEDTAIDNLHLAINIYAGQKL